MKFWLVTLPLYLLIVSTLFTPKPFSSLSIDTQLEYIYKEYGLMLEGHSNTIISITVHESLILTGSKDQTIRGWDLETGKQMFILYGHRSGVNNLLIHAGLGLLISGSWDGSVIFWELETRRQLKELKPHTEWVTQMKLQLPSTLWSVGNDGLINKYDLSTLTITKTAKIASSYIWSFDVSDESVVTATSDKNLTIWDSRTLEPVLSFKAHKTQINFASFMQNGKNVLSNGRDDGLALWDSKTAEVVDKVEKINRAKFIQKIEEDKILAVTRENQVFVWSLGLKGFEKESKIQNEGEIVLKFFTDSKNLWFARDFFVSKLDLATGSELDVTENLPVLTEVLLDHYKKVVLTKAEDGKVRIFDLSTGHVLEKVSTEDEAAKLEKDFPGVLNLFSSGLK